jgi:hypothetical protein
MVRSAVTGAKAERNGPTQGLHQHNTPVLVAHDRKGFSVSTISTPTRACKKARGLRIGLVDQPSARELRGAVDRDEEIELALRGLHFGDVDVEEADWIGPELTLGRSFALDLRQPRDSVTLKATMKRRARHMRDGRLQSIEAIVGRQLGVPSEGDDHGLFLDREAG